MVHTEEEANVSPILDLVFIIATLNNQLARLKLMQKCSRDCVLPWYMPHVMVPWENKCWLFFVVFFLDALDIDRETLSPRGELVSTVWACNEWCIVFRPAMAESLIPKCAFFLFSVLYPYWVGSSVKNWMRVWPWLCSMVSVMHVMTLVLRLRQDNVFLTF